jgi:hypothetical protein
MDPPSTNNPPKTPILLQKKMQEKRNLSEVIIAKALAFAKFMLQPFNRRERRGSQRRRLGPGSSLRFSAASAVSTFAKWLQLI